MGKLLRIVIEEKRFISPFNEPARELNVLNKQLWLFQREVAEKVLAQMGYVSEELPVPSIDAIPPGLTGPVLAYRDNLFFDEEFLSEFLSRAMASGKACQAAFRADDVAYRTYALPLTRGFVADKDANGNDIYRIGLWYFPNGWDDNPQPIVIDSEARELGYYTVPAYMSTEKRGDLVHYLPNRSMLSIESWVHVYYANIIFGIFAIGSRFEQKADRSTLYRLKILAKAMLEQRQVLSCSEVVHIGRNTSIDPSVVIQGPTFIGDNVTIEAGAVIVNSVIGDDVTISQGCQLMLSVVGKGCFFPFRAALFMSVFMEYSIAAQNTCLQMTVVGRNSFIGAGTTFTDFILLEPKDGPRPEKTTPGLELKAMGPNGLENTGQVVLGGCVGHNCRIGSGLIVYPARMIESDVVLLASEHRVIDKDVRYEDSDHHKYPTKYHPRLYPREGERVEESW